MLLLKVHCVRTSVKHSFRVPLASRNQEIFKGPLVIPASISFFPMENEK